MAVNRYVLTADVTVPAGTPATVTAGDPGTGGAASFGSVATTGGPLWAASYAKGQIIALDSAGPLYSAIGAGNLRAWMDTDEAYAGASN